MPETRRLDEITPYDRNPRLHPTDQVEQIGRSLERFGWTFPVLIDEENVLIAGHGRIEAADLVWSRGGTIRGLDGAEITPGEVPVIVARGWTDEMKRAYVIADNRLTENSEWDIELLRGEIAALAEAEFEVDLTGFTTADVQRPLYPEELTEFEPIFRFGDFGGWLYAKPAER